MKIFLPSCEICIIYTYSYIYTLLLCQSLYFRINLCIVIRKSGQKCNSVETRINGGTEVKLFKVC